MKAQNRKNFCINKAYFFLKLLIYLISNSERNKVSFSVLILNNFSISPKSLKTYLKTWIHIHIKKFEQHKILIHIQLLRFLVGSGFRENWQIFWMADVFQPFYHLSTYFIIFLNLNKNFEKETTSNFFFNFAKKQNSIKCMLYI